MTNYSHICTECGSPNTSEIGAGDYVMNPNTQGDYKRAIIRECNSCKKTFRELPVYNTDSLRQPNRYRI